MRANKLFKRPKAKDGDGRQVKIKHILIPAELAEDLAIIKAAYTARFNRRVTYEQLLRRWIDSVGRIDPDIPGEVEAIRAARQTEQERMAAGLGLTAEQFAENQQKFDPADPAQEPWKLKYFFEKDGAEVKAYPGDKAVFYANVNGKNTGMSRMLADGWKLINETGVEISWPDADKIKKMIVEHQLSH